MFVNFIYCLYSQETLEPFCNIARGSTVGTRTDCTYDHLSVGICNLGSYSSNLPSEFQVCTNHVCAIVTFLILLN